MHYVQEYQTFFQLILRNEVVEIHKFLEEWSITEFPRGNILSLSTFSKSYQCSI